MTSVGGEKLSRSCLLRTAAGDDRYELMTSSASLPLGHDALDQSDLATVGEVDVVVELGRGPDATDLDATVSLVKRLVLRGE
jgi:hypothetical protein